MDKSSIASLTAFLFIIWTAGYFIGFKMTGQMLIPLI